MRKQVLARAYGVNARIMDILPMFCQERRGFLFVITQFNGEKAQLAIGLFCESQYSH